MTRFLHFVDNDSLPVRGEGYSRLQKVDPVISALKTNFQSAYYPHCELSIDEAMIPRSILDEAVRPFEASQERIQGVGHGGCA